MNTQKKYFFKKSFTGFLLLFTFCSRMQENNVTLLIPCIKQNTESYTKEPYRFPVAYLGSLYEAIVDSSFGGSAVLQDTSFRSSYYLVVSDEIIFNFSKNGSIKGYSLSEEVASQAQFFKINLVLFVNDKNVTTYNWEIIRLEASGNVIPSNSIIFYCDPTLVNIKSFDESFSGVYPPFGSGTLILPTIEIISENKKSYAERASIRIHAGYGHKQMKTNY